MGSKDVLSCRGGFKGGGHSMGLDNRNCFRMAGGQGLPFGIFSKGIRIRMLNAGFGFGSCSSSRDTGIALIRKDLGMKVRSGGRRIRLIPGRRTVFSGTGGSVGIGGMGTSLFTV